MGVLGGKVWVMYVRGDEPGIGVLSPMGLFG
jgi:hypothetical protein